MRRRWITPFVIGVILVVPFVSMLVYWHLSYERSRFYFMVEIGNLEAIQRRLDQGFDVNEGNPLGRLAFKRTFGESTQEVATAELLIKRGAKIDAIYGSRTPLTWAANHGKTDLAKLLIDHGAAVNSPENYENGPLHEAVRQEDAAMVRLLVDRGAKADEPGWQGRTPLELAKISGHSEIIALLESGAAEKGEK